VKANVTEPVHTGAPAEFNNNCALYNLDTDIGEHNNIAAANPAQLQTMLARLKVLAGESVYPQSWTAPYQGPDYFCKDCPLAPVYGPDKPGLPWL
jgi:hypothetical protein